MARGIKFAAAFVAAVSSVHVPSETQVPSDGAAFVEMEDEDIFPEPTDAMEEKQQASGAGNMVQQEAAESKSGEAKEPAQELQVSSTQQTDEDSALVVSEQSGASILGQGQHASSNDVERVMSQVEQDVSNELQHAQQHQPENAEPKDQHDEASTLEDIHDQSIEDIHKLQQKELDDRDLLQRRDSNAAGIVQSEGDMDGAEQAPVAKTVAKTTATTVKKTTAKVVPGLGAFPFAAWGVGSATPAQIAADEKAIAAMESTDYNALGVAPPIGLPDMFWPMPNQPMTGLLGSGVANADAKYHVAMQTAQKTQESAAKQQSSAKVTWDKAEHVVKKATTQVTESNTKIKAAQIKETAESAAAKKLEAASKARRALADRANKIKQRAYARSVQAKRNWNLAEAQVREAKAKNEHASATKEAATANILLNQQEIEQEAADEQAQKKATIARKVEAKAKTAVAAAKVVEVAASKQEMLAQGSQSQALSAVMRFQHDMTLMGGAAPTATATTAKTTAKTTKTTKVVVKR